LKEANPKLTYKDLIAKAKEKFKKEGRRRMRGWLTPLKIMIVLIIHQACSCHDVAFVSSEFLFFS
jgi:hypothetical protein